MKFHNRYGGKHPEVIFVRSSDEQAVLDAARACFMRREVDGVTYMDSAVCTWNVARLVDAIRRLDGYPR